MLELETFKERTANINSYKVDAIKAYMILRCISPPRILIVSPNFIYGGDFAEQFKNAGFSVLNMHINWQGLSKKFDRIWNSTANSVVIEGNFIDIPDNEKFTGIYTCVYLYPNKSADYITKIIDSVKNGKFPKSFFYNDQIGKLRLLLLNNESEFHTQVQIFCKEVIEKNREMYKKYLDYFDNKILTVLI
jgi:hypothetical protein